MALPFTRCFTTTGFDTICEMASSNLRFGIGATKEVGYDVKENFMANRVVLFTDSTIRHLPCMTNVLESLERAGVGQVVVYDKVRVEPNDESFRQAINFLQQHSYDVVIALGGGSVMDTAKAANLYTCTNPTDFYDYVNAPIGKGIPVPAKNELKPLIAIPTTAGTGSETTGVAVFDSTAKAAKTGIASRQLKPVLGIIDPDNTATLPTRVATNSGLDVLCHAIESYTALPYTQRPKPSSPLHRPSYQGSNPIADVWSLFALQTCATYLSRAITDPDDVEARSKMLLASSAAGMGFGNAGVHLCHGMSYPISSQVKTYWGYETADHPLVPHGLSVVAAAPAVFSFTGVANPERHATCARILRKARCLRRGKQQQGGGAYRDSGAWLADEIKMLCNDLDVPMGLQSFGFTEEDIPSLVEGTLPQHRVTKISPRPVGRVELEMLFQNAMTA